MIVAKDQEIIETVHLFPVLDAKLIELLRSLTEEEWYHTTIAKKWLVKDIAAHLLDGNIRTLSLSRDRHSLVPTNPINSYQELVDYLNELNATWVNAMRRMSPGMLTDYLEITGKQFSEYLATLNPYDKAIFSVAWAGEQESVNWFHIAREYTEKFLHQQQIRDAVNKQGIMTREFYYPFIDTLMRALPYTYRTVMADTGKALVVTISTEIGGQWFLVKQEDGWRLTKSYQGPINSELILDPVTARKLFTKSITAVEASEQATIKGDENLGRHALTMISIMG